MIRTLSADTSLPLGALLRGEVEVLAGWVARWTPSQTFRQALVIMAGAGAFGAAMGSWRAPEQAVFSALKLPFVLLTTAAGNALINGMLAPLFGMDLKLRESFAAVLASFALAATILGAFSPLMLFLVWNIPPPEPGAPVAVATHSAMVLTLVAMIAFAGVTANVRLLQLLRRLGGDAAPALRLLLAWLTVNLLLGSQLSWILRPFVGNAEEAVRFLDPHALSGNFFEEVARDAAALWSHFSQ
jgi:hypothetical protein